LLSVALCRLMASKTLPIYLTSSGSLSVFICG
jgi:hypothetical protein